MEANERAVREAIQNIDSAIFTGCSMYNEELRHDLQEAIEVWKRNIQDEKWIESGE